MGYRIAGALDVLRAQVNTLHPNRSTKSDGWIGDTAHAATVSDHNPDPAGVVRALDLTNDPAHGFDASDFAETLRRNRDPRVKYVISDRRIFAGVQGPQPWVWRPYNGSNPHTSHVHISVRASSAGDDRHPWQLTGGTVPPRTTPNRPNPTGDLTVKLIDLRNAQNKIVTGKGVKPMQRLLGVTADGKAGPKTRDALLKAQRRLKLPADAVFGPATASALLGESR
jgi:peptidoglycan hydrolase-like protein with peptidoglycan-binding domain